jgi:hypothetical protein
MEIPSLRSLIEVYKPIGQKMKEDNSRRTSALLRRDMLVLRVSTLERELSTAKQLLTMTQAAQIEYSEGIRAIIETGLEQDINGVLFEKEYRVELDTSIVRGKNNTRVYLKDTKGRRIPPKTVEGDMLNQVLSFSGVRLVSERAGCPYVFYDEAFASANVRSLQLLKRLIHAYVAEGTSFVFVTQIPVLTYGMDRHGIHLESNGEVVVEVKQKFITAETDVEDQTQTIIDLFDEMNEGSEGNAEQSDETREHILDEDSGEGY